MSINFFWLRRKSTARKVTGWQTSQPTPSNLPEKNSLPLDFHSLSTSSASRSYEKEEA
jgi:hypothetical protein